MSKIIYCIFFVLAFPLSTYAYAGGSTQYHDMTLEGWKVFIEQSLVDNNDPRVFKALRVLRSKLYEAKNVLPTHHAKQLQKVPLWLSRNNGADVEYYFFETRVYRNDINPKMLGGIEFQNINNFLKMVNYIPALILHELAHAHHKNNYKKIDKVIMRAFKNAEKKNLYREVSYKRNYKIYGHYASKNAFEYFADLTTMYYGSNYYYPHNRSELKKHDPIGYEMIETAWQ